MQNEDQTTPAERTAIMVKLTRFFMSFSFAACLVFVCGLGGVPGSGFSVSQPTSAGTVSDESSDATGNQTDTLVVGGYYVGNSMTVEQIPFERYTHIFHPFITADVQGNLKKSSGRIPNRDLVSAAHKHGVRVILSLGGGSFELFPKIAHNEQAKKQFVDGVIEIVDEFGYDGLDLDWEHPDDKATGQDWGRLVTALRKLVYNRMVVMFLPSNLFTYLFVTVMKVVYQVALFSSFPPVQSALYKSKKTTSVS